MQEVELVHDTEFSWLSLVLVLGLGVVAVVQALPFHEIAKVRLADPS